MFGKKQTIDPMNYWDKQYKEMHQTQLNRERDMERFMRDIKVYEGIQHYLPPAESALMNKPIEERRKMIQNTIAAYDDTNREMRTIYDKLDYCKEWVEIKPSIKMVEDAYRRMEGLWNKK